MATTVPSTGRSDNGTKGGILTATSEFDSSFTDSSSTLFSLYLSHAEKYDEDQVKTWKAGAQGILVFVRSALLFGSIIPSFTMYGTLTNNYCIIHILDRTVRRCPRHIRGDNYKSLLPDPARNAVVLLAQISQQLGGLSNGTHVPIAASTFLFPPSSARQSLPPSSAIWVNSLWFLSLIISLFCALLATLQQRWARRYLGLTQPHVAIYKRAHIRSFFAKGVTRFHFHVAVEALPALLHISVFLFLAGLVISLFTIHHTVAYLTLSATVACILFYTAITVMPIVYHDSPYTSP